jgi:hypothetical protein
MKSVAIRRELQARPARWCASWGRPKLTDRAAEWGSVSSCSRSTALAIKTPCTHRCVRGQEKYIRQCVCAAAFGRNSCLGYCSSSSSSVCCVRLSVRALLSSKSRRSIPARADDRARADGRSQQEPTVDPSKSRRSIPTTVWVGLKFITCSVLLHPCPNWKADRWRDPDSPETTTATGRQDENGILQGRKNEGCRSYLIDPPSHGTVKFS